MPFSFTVLGSSSALPTSERFPSAYVLRMHERIFLLDCGEGTQMQLRRFKIRMGRLNHILISHLHGDHTFGLFGLLSSFNLMGRSLPLHIYAPPEIENILEQIFNMFGIILQYPLTFHPLKCGQSEQIYEDKRLTIHTIPLKHRIPTCGFLFREKPGLRHLIREKVDSLGVPVANRPGIAAGDDFLTQTGEIIPNEDLTTPPSPSHSFAYCTDTLFNRGMISKIRDVDLLFHEATFMNEDAQRARETFHSTATQAAQIAKEAGIGKLVIGHFSARYKVLEPLLDEARAVFEKTELATDGKTYEVC